jgi:glycogen debranching enzyme
MLSTLWYQALKTLKSLQVPLGIMASSQDDHFHAIFGRDSLWSVLLALEAGRLQTEEEKASGQYDAWLYELVASVLRGLASLQGRVVNDENEEQPGRIVHEYWNPVPQRMITWRWPLVDGCYYGAFDSTFLFVFTIAQTEAYFHDAQLLEELWPNVEAALQWMLAWSDLDQDGLVEYKVRNPEGRGLRNQVWKDSSESIQSRDGEPMDPPYAWIEVQGYAWEAYAGYLKLAEQRHSLDPAQRREIEQRMARLCQGLQQFWLPGEQFPAIVLDAHKKPIEAVSSNPGHLLWGEFLTREQAAQISQRLTQPDILTPWGARTLSDQAYYFNPLLYQCGTVWPFDNAILAVGLHHHGFYAEARGIAQRILHAIEAMQNPVELYMVLPSERIRAPRLAEKWALVDYYQSTTIQAWTAAGVLYLASLLLNQETSS